MTKKPNPPTELDSKLEAAPSNNDRRVFVKTVAAGVTSISFAKGTLAAGEASLPNIVSFLLDELPLDTPIRLDTKPDNSVQSIEVPSGAVSMNVEVYGAGGSATNGNSAHNSGASGGSGGKASGSFRVSDLNNRVLTVHIGEGATAGEAYEASTGGAFGGGDGGTTRFTSEDASGNPAVPTFGGAGGGYTGLFDGDQVLMVGGGGGGGGGVGQTAAVAGGGGDAKSSSNESRVGGDGNGDNPGQGGQFHEGGFGSFEQSGGDGSDFNGGSGGLSHQTDTTAGGAGGGGGAGYAHESSSYPIGGGGGGGAGTTESTFGASGGGGAGGANYFAPHAFNEPNDFEPGASGGEAGYYGEGGGPGHLETIASSGEDGWMVVEFSTGANESYVPDVAPVTFDETSSFSTTCSSAITDGGGSPVFERGVVYSNESSTPDENDLIQQATTAGAGHFEVDVTGLAPSTQYYFRAYGRNDLGYGFGSASSVTTPSGPTVKKN